MVHWGCDVTDTTDAVKILHKRYGIGAQIKKRRLQLGMTQKDLADKLGVVQSEISRAESLGYDRLSLTGLRRIAGGLDAEVRVQLVRLPRKGKR